MKLISDEEKKELFNRIAEVEIKVNNFIEEVRDKVEDCIKEINNIKK